MRDISPEQERPRGSQELTGLIASTAMHAALLICMSVFFLTPEPKAARIEAKGDFVNEPLPVVTTIVEPELAIEQPQRTTIDAAAVFAVDSPIQSTGLMPQGLSDQVAPPAGNDSSLPPGVASIQKRVEQAGGKAGEIQFSLSWDDTNDLDLHVIIPEGPRIFWKERRHGRGELDVDMNVNGESRKPVENVRWLKGKARSGRYTVLVNFFQQHEAHRGVAFEIAAKLGRKTELVKDKVGIGRNLKAFHFIYVRPSVGVKRRAALRRKYEKLQVEEEEIASKLLTEALAGGERDREKLSIVAFKYPHTDASLKALRLLPGTLRK